MALLSRDLLFGGLRAIAKKLRRKQTSSNKRPRSPSASTPGPHVDNSRSSSYSSSPSSPDSSSTYRSDIRRVFAEYDADGDGRISLHDLTRIVTAVGGSGLSESDASEEAAAMMEVADLDRDGYIAFEEFQALMTTTTTPNPSSPHLGSPHVNASVPPEDAPNGDNGLPTQPAPCASTCIPSGPDQEGWAWDAGDDDDLRQAFAVYDHDGDGVITAHEILAVLRRVLDTTTITLADCRRMVQAADRDGDGVVGFHDFAAMMMIR